MTQCEQKRLLRSLTSLLSCLVVSLISFNVSAKGCSVLEFLGEKSVATTVLVNPCLSKRKMGVGAMFDLSPRGRLWLKSDQSEPVPSHYQLICRNRSEKRSSVRITRSKFPWIEAGGGAKCGDWVDNRIECRDSVNGSEVLFCAIASITKAPKNHTIQLKTSLILRSSSLTADSSPSAPSAVQRNKKLEKLIGKINQEIGLCRTVYRNEHPFKAEWVIKSTGEITHPSSKKSAVDQAFASCVYDVVKSFKYPAFSEDIRVSYTFE